MGGISGKFLKEFLDVFEELLAHAYPVSIKQLINTLCRQLILI